MEDEVLLRMSASSDDAWVCTEISVLIVLHPIGQHDPEPLCQYAIPIS